MLNKDALAIDRLSPPFDQFRSIRWLAPARSGHHSPDHARHQLYVGREKQHPASVLIKVTSKPGLVYEHDLDNEINSLSTINRELPDSRYFPVVRDHGRLTDGRLYLITSLFDEFPLATTIGEERVPGKLVAHLKTAIEISRALTDIHGLDIFHVDLNPMNVLYRTGTERPVIRLVDFESSYERRRHTAGVFYSPPTTPGYSAPEVSSHAPDVRSDVFSLGAVLYALLAGYRWTDGEAVSARVKADPELDAELKDALLIAVDPDPGKRYHSAQEFQAALGAYLERIWPGRSW
ncbi:MAG: protein kinase [Vicinamibacterales bacterium]